MYTICLTNPLNFVTFPLSASKAGDIALFLLYPTLRTNMYESCSNSVLITSLYGYTFESIQDRKVRLSFFLLQVYVVFTHNVIFTFFMKFRWYSCSCTSRGGEIQTSTREDVTASIHWQEDTDYSRWLCREGIRYRYVILFTQLCFQGLNKVD